MDEEVVKPGELVLDRYIVEGLLGKGGMGRVYRARHHRLGQPVALKVLTRLDAATYVDRFEQEAQLMARIRHPNVVAILDYGALGDRPCIAMEFIDGETLTERHRRGVMTWFEAVKIVRDVLRGLEAIHKENVLHRDLKPSNVVICPGDPEVVKLIDFGIARVEEDHDGYTRTGVRVGTPAFMSPEQLVGSNLDARSDLYAVGLILYLLTTGKLPWGDSRNPRIEKRLLGKVPPPEAPGALPPLPPGLVAVILHLLAGDPDNRPPTARAALEELANIASTPRAPALDAVAPSTSAPAPAPDYSVPSHTSTSVIPGSGAHYLVAARIPPSLLARPETRQWLAAVTGRAGRGFTFGAQTWFALMRAPTGDAVEKEAADITAQFAAQFGSTGKIVWAPVTADFRLSPASVTGAQPLPPQLQALFDEVAS